VDTKIINAYHEKSQKLIGSGLVIVDAALEPLKVLKVLMEGLSPDRKAGLWLTNFKGVPVARTLSPFDLIYLDKSYGVVHCVEISTEGEYEPFRGEPASALVLPPQTISSTRVRAGDRLAFRAVDDPSARPAGSEQAVRPQAAPAPQPPTQAPGRAQFFNSAFAAPAPQDSGSPLDQFLEARSTRTRGPAPAANAATALDENPRAILNPSGRLTKSAQSILGNPAALRPSTGQDSVAEALEGSQVSIVIATDPGSYNASAAAQRAPAPTRIVPATVTKNFNSPSDYAQESRSSNAVPSGRLMRGVHLAPEILPDVEPEGSILATEGESFPILEAQTANATVPQTDDLIERQNSDSAVSPAPSRGSESRPERSLSPVVPISAASEPSQPTASTALQPVASPQESPMMAAPAATTPVPVEPAAPPRVSVPAIISPSPTKPILRGQPSLAANPVPITEKALQPPIQETANGTVLPITKEPAIYPRTQIQPAKPKEESADPRKAKHPWDIRLLYLLFPEFDPARPPEIRIPRADQVKEPLPSEDDTPSRKLQFLCWLYPHLHLERVEQKRSEQRRAVRLPMPGLVAYFFTGGSPRPHPIKDISVTGFYMHTEERWLPGTIVRVTLQMVGPSGEGGRDSITVHSRVVRWGPDGGGFEFVLPGFLES
jgi:PilZ domain-containing protein